MVDQTKIEIEALLVALKTLYKKAEVNEQNNANSTRELRQLTAHIQSVSEKLPSTVASGVKAQLNDATSKVADVIIEKHKDANLKAIEATEAYTKAVRLSFWRYALLFLVCAGSGLGSAVLAAIYIVPQYVSADTKSLYDLKNEVAQLRREILINRK